MINLIEQFPQWLQIFLFSMIPGFESRFVIPIIAINQFNWEWWRAFPFAIAGNMFLVPFGLLFLYKIEKILGKFRFFKKIMEIVFPKIRKKADKKIQRYESFALVFFVAIPLPFTGAWTGALIAYLFDLEVKKSIVTIFIGVLIAASIMIAITLLFGNIFGYTFNG